MAVSPASLRRLFEVFRVLDGEALDISVHADFVRQISSDFSHLSQIRSRLSPAEICDAELTRLIDHLKKNLAPVPVDNSAEGSMEDEDEVSGGAASIECDETLLPSPPGSPEGLSSSLEGEGEDDCRDDSAPAVAIKQEAEPVEHPSVGNSKSMTVTVLIPGEVVDTNRSSEVEVLEGETAEATVGKPTTEILKAVPPNESRELNMTLAQAHLDRSVATNHLRKRGKIRKDDREDLRSLRKTILTSSLKRSPGFTLSDDSAIACAAQYRPDKSWCVTSDEKECVKSTRCHIAEELGWKFSPAQIAQRWRRVLKPKVKDGCERGLWSPKEEESLLSAEHLAKNNKWRRVSLKVKTRSELQCKHYWKRIVRSRAVAWTAEEQECFDAVVDEIERSNTFAQQRAPWVGLCKRFYKKYRKQHPADYGRQLRTAPQLWQRYTEFKGQLGFKGQLVVPEEDEVLETSESSLSGQLNSRHE